MFQYFWRGLCICIDHVKYIIYCNLCFIYSVVYPVKYIYTFCFRSDCESASSVLCSFPVANVSLLKNGKEQVRSSHVSWLFLLIEMICWHNLCTYVYLVHCMKLCRSHTCPEHKYFLKDNSVQKVSRNSISAVCRCWCTVSLIGYHLSWRCRNRLSTSSLACSWSKCPATPKKEKPCPPWHALWVKGLSSCWHVLFSAAFSFFCELGHVVAGVLNMLHIWIMK